MNMNNILHTESSAYMYKLYFNILFIYRSISTTKCSITQIGVTRVGADPIVAIFVGATR